MDQTSFMAELQGATTALACANTAGVPVHLIIDNKGVQRGVDARLRGEKPIVDFYGGMWKKIEDLCATLPDGCACSWVPAHGRHLSWDAERAPAVAKAWRDTNDAADVAASTESYLRWNEVMRPFAQSETLARARATSALNRLHWAEQAYTNKWLTTAA
jgi:hypothetical protein